MEDLENILKDTRCPDGFRSHHHNCPTCNGTEKKFHEVWKKCLCVCHQSTLRRSLAFVDSGGLLIHLHGCKPYECIGYVFSVSIDGLLGVLWGLGGHISFWHQELGCIIRIKNEPYRGQGDTSFDALSAALWEVLKSKTGG